MEVERRRRCPHCRQRLSGNDPLVPGTAPKAGDLAVCGLCGGIAVYAVGQRCGRNGPRKLDVRAPTPDEQQRADADPRIAAARMALAATKDSRAAVPVWRRLTEEAAEEPVPREQ